MVIVYSGNPKQESGYTKGWKLWG